MRSVVLVTAVFVQLALLRAQSVPYAARIIEYSPAPGQYINDPLAGTPAAAFSTLYRPDGMVSLGGFGGYIIYGFDHRIMNDPANPYGIDFTVFGNSLTTHAEQGIICVMKDVNNNGKADDTWYEICGSEHYSGRVNKDYSITYYNPRTQYASNVPWKDNSGKNGFLICNSFHLQSYYPDPAVFSNIPPDSISFKGSLISAGNSILEGAIVSLPSAFGYADNRPMNSVSDYTIPDNPYTFNRLEGSGGDAIDISWAVDSNGNYVDLDGIDFVMIYTGLNANAGWLGELSTEVRGIADVSPNPDLKGTDKIILPLNLPERIAVNSSLDLISLYLERGRLIKGKEIEWLSSDQTKALVVSDTVIRALEAGNATLQSRLKNTGEILYEKNITISTPSELRIGNIPGLIMKGQEYELTLSILDNSGIRLEGIYPDISVTDDQVLQILDARDGRILFKALNPGITRITFSFSKYPQLDKYLEFIVKEEIGSFEVSVSIMRDTSCIFPRKNHSVSKQDISKYIDRKESGFIAGRDFISIADVLASVLLKEGFNTAGNKFSFRQDEAGDHNLYLWQFGMNYEFTYGWGGIDSDNAHAKAWVALLNDQVFVNGWDTIRVRPGDVVSFRHIEDIREPWTQIQILPSKHLSDPGDDIKFTVKQFQISKYSDRKFSMSGPFILPDARVLVNKKQVPANSSFLCSDYMGEFTLQFMYGGEYLVGIDSHQSESAEIIINYALATDNSEDVELKVYPNPCHDKISIEGLNPDFYLVRIYSLKGELCGSENIKNKDGDIIIDTSHFQKGVYFLELVGDKRVIIKKIIKY